MAMVEVLCAVGDRYGLNRDEKILKRITMLYSLNLQVSLVACLSFCVFWKTDHHIDHGILYFETLMMQDRVSNLIM